MKIEIDFEVYKALTNMRSSEEETENDVLRKLLQLPAKNEQEPLTKSNGAWISKGIEFPHGTEFRMSYKGNTMRQKWIMALSYFSTNGSAHRLERRYL